MRSIRVYLLSRLIAGSALVLLVAGVAVYVLVARSLEAQFDRNLGQRVQGLASLLFQVEDEVEFAFSDELMPEYSRAERPLYFELAYAGGPPLERSESTAGRPLAPDAAPVAGPRTWTAPLPDGRVGRWVDEIVVVHHVYPEEGPDRPEAAQVRIVVASGREDLVATERLVLASCAGACALLLGLIALIAWSSVRRGLAPASRLAAALAAIQVEALPRSLGVGDLPGELQPMADKAAALMRRVDLALERERRTTADIAHELRTPLSEVLTAAEVALRNGHDAEEARRALGTVRDVASRMGHSVTTLLKLARLEAGTERFAREPVALEPLLDEALRPLAALQRERGLRIEQRGAEAAALLADPDVLRIVLANLLGNAAEYAPRGSAVAIACERSGDVWSLSIENEAPDLAREDLSVLCQPSWRKDRARADRGRSGLGLALARALAEKSGLDLGFELEGGRFRAVLRGAAASESARSS